MATMVLRLENPTMGANDRKDESQNRIENRVEDESRILSEIAKGLTQTTERDGMMERERRNVNHNRNENEEDSNSIELSSAPYSTTTTTAFPPSPPLLLPPSDSSSSPPSLSLSHPDSSVPTDKNTTNAISFPSAYTNKSAHSSSPSSSSSSPSSSSSATAFLLKSDDVTPYTHIHTTTNPMGVFDTQNTKVNTNIIIDMDSVTHNSNNNNSFSNVNKHENSEFNLISKPNLKINSKQRPLDFRQRMYKDCKVNFLIFFSHF